MPSGGDIILAQDLTKLETKVVQLTADSSGITGTTLVTVMTFTLSFIGTYEFDGIFGLTNTGAVGRPGLGFGGTCTTSAWRWNGTTTHYNSATASQNFNASGTTAPGSGTAIVNSDFTTTTGHSGFVVKGLFTVSAIGTWTVRWSEASGSGTVTVKAGSMCSVRYTP